MLRQIIWRSFSICLAAVILCSFAAAQKSEKPLSAEDFYRRGLEKKQNLQGDSAKEDFDKAIELNPREARFYLARAEYFTNQMKKDEALADFNKAIELRPDYVEAYMARGNLLFVDRPEQTLQDFNQAIKLSPQRADFYRQRASLYFRMLGNQEEAFRDLASAIRLEPRDTYNLQVRADYHRANEEFEKAIADCTAILKIEPRDSLTIIQRGRDYFSIGAYQKAIDDFSLALKIEPQLALSILKRRAEAYYRLGKIKLAEADEREAEKIEAERLKNVPRIVSPPKALTEEELTDSYIYTAHEKINPIPDSEENVRNLVKQEIIRLTKLLDEAPALYARAFVMRGNNYMKLGEYDKAIADYTQATEHFECDAFNHRGIAYARKGEMDAALADFARALDAAECIKFFELNLEPHSIRYNRGLALLNKGEFKLAIAELTACIKGKPNDVRPYRLRAKAYRKLGQTAEAQADEAMVKRLEAGIWNQ
jgi:tetratricopeptide (TPR) repeat protein